MTWKNVLADKAGADGKKLPTLEDCVAAARQVRINRIGDMGLGAGMIRVRTSNDVFDIMAAEELYVQQKMLDALGLSALTSSVANTATIRNYKKALQTLIQAKSGDTEHELLEVPLSEVVLRQSEQVLRQVDAAIIDRCPQKGL